jgi:hypothetical protein
MTPSRQLHGDSRNVDGFGAQESSSRPVDNRHTVEGTSPMYWRSVAALPLAWARSRAPHHLIPLKRRARGAPQRGETLIVSSGASLDRSCRNAYRRTHEDDRRVTRGFECARRKNKESTTQLSNRPIRSERRDGSDNGSNRLDSLLRFVNFDRLNRRGGFGTLRRTHLQSDPPLINGRRAYSAQRLASLLCIQGSRRDT